jgi:hypothetical protein
LEKEKTLKSLKIKIPHEYLELKRPISGKEDTAKMVRPKEHSAAICTGMNRWVSAVEPFGKEKTSGDRNMESVATYENTCH